MKRLPKKEILTVTKGLASVILLALFIYFFQHPGTKLGMEENNKTATTTTKKAATATPKKPRVPATFSTIRLQGRSAAVYDISSDTWLYQKNSDEVLPIASITKIMTGYAALTTASPETIIKIDPDLEGYSTTTSPFRPGEEWHLKDLLAVTLVSSSNIGAAQIASALQLAQGRDFVSLMNSLAQNIGLHSTTFHNPTGLDLERGAVGGSYSTAREIATLFSYVYKNKPEVFAGTDQSRLTRYSIDNAAHQVFNTNVLVASIPHVFASKTGTTGLAGSSLAIIFSPIPNHPTVVVVLGSTTEGRYSDMQKMVEATINHFKK